MSLKPTSKPKCPNFSSGPCAKHPGYSVSHLDTAVLGRSHRSKLGKARLKLAIDLQKEILGIPKDYHLGIVAGSDTGAVEMALWSLLGPLGVDVLAWESFGKDWVTDVTKQLKLKDVRTFEAGYGKAPDFSQVDTDRDVVFTWNGTTSGVKVPNGDWIKDSRKGLTICDATSAVYAMELPWEKLDVVTYSWQKVLGGEGGHGILILSPRAVARLESYTPSWPMPKTFRLSKGGKLAADIFEGATINTPSMLAVEDEIDVLLIPRRENKRIDPEYYTYKSAFQYAPVLFTLPDHPLAGKKNLTMAEICKYEVTMPSKTMTVVANLYEVMQRHRKNKRFKLTFEDWWVMRKYIEEGLAISISADMSHEGKRDMLAKTSLLHLFPVIDYGFVTKKNRKPDRNLQALYDTAEKYSKKISSDLL